MQTSCGSMGASLLLHFVATGDDTRDQSIANRVLRADPEVPVGVLNDLLVSLTGFVRDDAVDALAHLDDLFGLDGDVGGLPGDAAQRLVQQKARIGQAEPVLPFRAEEN